MSYDHTSLVYPGNSQLSLKQGMGTGNGKRKLCKKLQLGAETTQDSRLSSQIEPGTTRSRDEKNLGRAQHQPDPGSDPGSDPSVDYDVIVSARARVQGVSLHINGRRPKHGSLSGSKRERRTGSSHGGGL